MSNLKNRRIALHHAVAMAIADRFQSPREVVNAADLFADFLNDDVAVSITEVDAAKIVELVKERAADESVSAYSVFANTCIVEMGLKNKTVAKLADFLKEAGGYMNGDIADVVGASPEILKALGKKRALEFVFAVCNTANDLGLDPKEAVFAILEDHLDPESAELKEATNGWDAMIDIANISRAEENGEVCPGCGQVHNEMTIPTPDTLVRDVFSKEGADMLNARGVENFGDLMRAGPVAFLDLPPVDVGYMHEFIGRIVKSKNTIFRVMTNGYAKLPLDSFGDVDPALVETLAQKGIHDLSGAVSSSENLEEFVSLAGAPTFINLVSHMITALSKEVEENEDISDEGKKEIAFRLEGLKRILTMITAANLTNAAIRDIKKPKAARPQPVETQGEPAQESKDQIEALLDAYQEKYPQNKRGDALLVDTNMPEGAALFKALQSAGVLNKAEHPLQGLLDSLFAARSTRH